MKTGHIALIALLIASITVSPAHASDPQLPAETSNWIDELPLDVENKTLLPALQALENNQIEDAYQMLLAFVKEDASSAEAWELLGVASLAKNHPMDAVASLVKALELDPNRLVSLVLFADAALKSNDPERARSLLEGALKQDPEVIPARKAYATALLRLGRFEDAANEVIKCLDQTNEEDVGLKHLLASIRYKQGRNGEAEQLLDEVLTREPDLREAKLLQGLIKLDLQKYQEASDFLQEYLEQDPHSPWARLGMATVWQIKGELPKAREELIRLVNEQPQWSFAYLKLGEIYLYEENLERALQAFKMADKGSTDDPLIKIRIASTFLKFGKFSEAIAQLRDAKQALESVPEARKILAQAYLLDGRPDLAEQELKAAVAVYPDSAQRLMELGLFYVNQKRFFEALEQFKKAAAFSPASIEPLQAQIEVYAKQGNEKEALAIVKGVEERVGSSPQVELFRGWMHEQFDRFKKAEQVYQKLKQHEERLVSYQALRSLVRVYANTGQFKEGIGLLSEALQTYPDDSVLRFDLAGLYTEKGEFQEAVSLYRLILEKEPYNAFALNNLAYLLSQNPETLPEAFQYAQIAYRLAPGLPFVLDTLGWIHYLKGDLAPAEQFINLAVVGMPDNAQLRYHRGMVYLKQNRSALARIDLTKALEDPDFKDAKSAREALKSL